MPPIDLLGQRRRTFAGYGYTVVELAIVLAIVGVLSAVAIPIYGGYVDRQDRRTAINDIRVLEAGIERFRTEFGALPESINGIAAPGLLDPWGKPYVYVNMHTHPAQARKDKNLHPLNTDFDLYSKGKDGGSLAPLTAKVSQDDIVRANDGVYVGLAIDY